MTSTKRRDFLATAAAAAGYGATAFGYPANETINIACIGAGGRARRLMKTMEQVRGTRWGAVCDIWDQNLKLAKEIADPKAFATKNYHEVLERKDIDAVLIGAPDHWHVPMTIDACQAGKDVYVEKPLTHEISEGPAVIRAQNENKRIVQVGMQQRSMPQFLEGLDVIKSGVIGEIHKVHLTWNRNALLRKRPTPEIDPGTVGWDQFLGKAKEQPFDPLRFRNWRWFWDFGGGILTDLMVHYIDVANWYLGLDHPETATTIGDTFLYPQWETPDTIQTLLRYPEQQVQIYFEGTFINARNAAMLEFMGSEATLYLDRGRYEIHPERGRPIEYKERILGSNPKGADFDVDGGLEHLQNWVDCIRSRKKPNAPAEAGVAAASGAHLGNIAFRTGRVASWDAAA